MTDRKNSNDTRPETLSSHDFHNSKHSPDVLPAVNPEQRDPTVLIPTKDCHQDSDEPTTVFEILNTPMDAAHVSRAKAYARLLGFKDAVILLEGSQPA